MRVLLQEALEEELPKVGGVKLTQGQSGQKFDGLYMYDLEILRHLADGLSYKQIAARMNITHDTVKTRLGRAFAETGMSNAQALIAYAFRRGLIK